ncbi:MAG: hypothetical protein HC923_11625 [Myxococcales bacterium]|nr:hypothetical protein [Myxococcales bacterium]
MAHYESRAELCFPGDTDISVLDEEDVRAARVLLLECTFVKEGLQNKARRGGHIHLEDISAAQEKLQNDHVVLVHFSQRHHRSEVERLTRERLSASLLDRLHLMV